MGDQVKPAPLANGPAMLAPGARIAVIGAGSMGAGIAQLAAQSGHPVRIHDLQPGAAVRAIERIAADLQQGVTRGRISGEERQTVLERIEVAEAFEALAGSALVVEAIAERLEAKRELFLRLEKLLGAGAILASNTSSISITAIAEALEHPERVVGWHFFNPPTRLKLVEIIRGVATGNAAVQTLVELSRAWGKVAIEAPNAPGFIVNRVARPFYAESLRLLGERIAPLEAIDRLVREAGGFAMGPFELIDLIGADVNLSVTESVFAATSFDGRYAPHLIQQELVRSGRLGRKTGAGFYDYGPAARKPIAQPVLASSVPAGIRCASDMGLLAPLVTRLTAQGVKVAVDAAVERASFCIDAVQVALSDGRTAAEVASLSQRPTVLIDLALDYALTPVLGAACSWRAPGEPDPLAMLAGVLSCAGIDLIALDDVAGLVLTRLVSCLANEAADLHTWSGTPAADIDLAMKLGTSYPVGPLAWADALGAGHLRSVLENLRHHYGDQRYRCSPALSRAAFQGSRFHV